jgi:tetratricopeptide (TPR) repeat protein
VRAATELAIACLLLCAAPAAAQNVEATATAQFDQGRALMKQGKYKEACAAFEKSQELDAQNGTLFNLAECEARIGKLASAWLAYRELAQFDSNAGRGKEAGRRARELEKRLPRLLLRLTSPPAGLAVTINGKDATSLVGIENPTDLGRYAIRATAPGYAAFETTASLTVEARTVTVRLELIKQDIRPERSAARSEPRPEPERSAARSEPRPEPERSAARSEPRPEPEKREAERAAEPEAEPADEPRAPTSHRKRNGVIAGVAGGGLIAVGVVFGLRARSDWNDAETVCPGRNCASAVDRQRGDALVDSARGNAALSTGFFVGGAAVAAVGVYLIATARPDASTALRVAPTQGGAAVVLGGRW